MGMTGRKCDGPVDSVINVGVVTEGSPPGIWFVDEGNLGLLSIAMETPSSPPLSEECQLEAESWLSLSSVDTRELSRNGKTCPCVCVCVCVGVCVRACGCARVTLDTWVECYSVVGM